jgi:hypothetical protein
MLAAAADVILPILPRLPRHARGGCAKIARASTTVQDKKRTAGGISGDAAIAAAIAARSGDNAIASAAVDMDEGKMGSVLEAPRDDMILAISKGKGTGGQEQQEKPQEQIESLSEVSSSTSSPIKRKREDGDSDTQSRPSKRALDARTQATLKLLGEVPALRGICEFQMHELATKH